MFKEANGVTSYKREYFHVYITDKMYTVLLKDNTEDNNIIPESFIVKTNKREE